MRGLRNHRQSLFIERIQYFFVFHELAREARQGFERLQIGLLHSGEQRAQNVRVRHQRIHFAVDIRRQALLCTAKRSALNTRIRSLRLGCRFLRQRRLRHPEPAHRGNIFHRGHVSTCVRVFCIVRPV